MVALTDPNQVLQTALGGQNTANNFTASKVGPMLGDLVGNAPAPVPQQTELPEINIDALRKISDPRIMQMAFNMLMQRDAMKARGGQVGLMPGEYQFMTAQERRAATLNKYFGTGSQTDLMKDLKEAQDVINAGTDFTGGERTIKKGHERAVAEAEERVLDLTQERRNANIIAAQKRIAEREAMGPQTEEESPEGRVEPTKKTEPKVRVISPNGVRGSIPASRLQEALKNGYKRA
jgi:hypothetical protein